MAENVNKFVVEWEDSQLTLDEYRQGTGDLEKTIESLEGLVAEIENIIPGNLVNLYTVDRTLIGMNSWLNFVLVNLVKNDFALIHS